MIIVDENFIKKWWHLCNKKQFIYIYYIYIDTIYYIIL